MQAFIIIAFFILGTIIGSFLNVVVLRFRTGKTLGGRSMCFSCGKKLHWHELVPLFSFLAQRGKCKGCRTKISWQYPIVEVATGVLFALSAMYFFPLLYLNFSYFILHTSYFVILFSLLVAITIYDFHHKIIPNEFVYTFIVVAIIGLFLPAGLNSIAAGWYNVFAGVLIAVPFALLWLVSKGKWMGLGDPKLMLGMGTVLGLSQGIAAVVVSFWIAAIIGVFLLVTRRAGRKTEVPFAPFLALGFAIAVFCKLEIFSLLSCFS